MPADGGREAGTPRRYEVRRLRGALALTVLVLAGFVGCRPEGGRPDVILVSIDTLRPDHLGVYGYLQPTSPHLDAFRADAVLFEKVIAQAPSTLPSHASIFTSLIPQHHGASHTFDLALPQEAVTVTEIFARAGYRTLGVVAGGQLAPEYGLDQGFDVYESLSRASRFEDTVRRGLILLDAAEGPSFLFLHTYEVHHPYTPEAGQVLALAGDEYRGPLPEHTSVELLERINRGEVSIDAEDRRHIVRGYDAEIRSVDAAFGQLIRELKERRRYRNAVIAFTSDHGEEFGEHGRMGWHATTLHDELLRVPWLIKLPAEAAAGLTIGASVRSLDVAPTLLEIAGLPVPPEFRGRGLSVAINKGHGRDLYAVSWRESRRDSWPDHSSLRRQRFKLVEGRLYDLREDPLETSDLAARHPALVREMEAQLHGMVRERPALGRESVEVDPETLRELRALGYLD
jgi:arylsulfatase A-like enzyme